MMEYCNIVFRKLLLWIVIPLFLSSCSIPTAYNASVNQEPLTSQQMAVSIKYDVSHNSQYENSYQANKYLEYVNVIVEQVKSKKISENKARALLLKSYKQFRAGKYYLEEPSNLPPQSPIPIPRQIPEKPGAL